MAKSKTPTKAKRDKATKIWKEYKAGNLNVGKSNKVVKSPAQAKAIMLSTLGIKKKSK